MLVRLCRALCTLRYCGHGTDRTFESRHARDPIVDMSRARREVIKGVLIAETKCISKYQHHDTKRFRRMKNQMFRNPCTCIFSRHKVLREIPSPCLHAHCADLILSAWWWSRRWRVQLFSAVISAWRLL